MNQDQSSLPTSSHAYGIGLIALVVGAAVGVSYYQLYFVSEYNATPRYLIYNPAIQLNLLFHNW